MYKTKMLISLLAIGFILSTVAFAENETALFSFEKDAEGWGIPKWTAEKPEYVGKTAGISNKFASKGDSALEITANFPGGLWTAAYAEIADTFDWTAYSTLSADLYIPDSAPAGLRARLVLTVSDDWTWVEASHAVNLVPGQWVTLTANLKPGSTDWKIAEVTDNFRKEIKKLGVRVESNMKPAYQGPIYLDNISVK